MSRLRVGVIGAGAWGRNHVRTLASMPDVELTAVCDLSASVREKTSRAYPGVLVTDSVQALLERVDAVVVASTARTHAALGLEAVRAGKPVMVEKPYALTVREAVELAEESDRLKGCRTSTTS